MRRLTTALLAIAILTAPALAQSPGGGQGMSRITSLSQAELEGLENGRGMGMGRLGELNRYPGPRHVLELAAELELTEAQQAETQKVFADMRTEAIRTGRQIIEAEAALDKAFAEGSVDDKSLQQALTQIGLLRARLRYVHLEAHLRQRALLTDTQVATYDKLRAGQRGGQRHRMHDQGRMKGKGQGHGQAKDMGDCPCGEQG